MNLWFFTFEFPPEKGGGLSTYMKHIARLYAAREDTVQIITLDHRIDVPMEEQELAPNVRLLKFSLRGLRRVSELGHWTAVSHVMSDVATRLLSQSAQGLRDFGVPDVIEFADGFGIGYFTVQRKLCLDRHLRNVPVVVTAHTPTYMIDRLNGDSVYKLPVYWHSIMERAALAGCDAIVTPSNAMIERLRGEIDRDLPPVHLVRNPYEADEPDAARETGDAFDHFFVASRLTYWKGVDHIAKVFSRLWEDGFPHPLRLYGSDTFHRTEGMLFSDHLATRYKRHRDAGLLRIEGLKDRADIDRAARTAFAQIHPSLWDNFPYTVLEALGRGLLCITHSAGGMNEILEHGRHALVTDIEDVQGTMQTITAACTLDRAERRRMREAALEMIGRECGYDAFYKRKRAVLEDVIRRKSARSSFPFIAGDISSTETVRSERENEGLLSVVIPYFNMGAFVDEAVDSVWRSTYRPIEIVIVNDGSTDPASAAKLKELERRHGPDGLRVVHTENQGVARARNRGATEAAGAYLALLDADDMVTRSYYARAIAILRAYDNVAFVGSWNEDFNAAGRIRDWPTFNTEPPMQMIFNSTNCQGLVYHRDVFLQHGRHDPDLAMFLDDWEATIALMAAGYRGVMIPEALFRYRVRDHSIFRSRAALWEINYEKICTKHRALFDRWGAEIAAFMNANGPNRLYHIPGLPSAYDGGTPGTGIRSVSGAIGAAVAGTFAPLADRIARGFATALSRLAFRFKRRHRIRLDADSLTGKARTHTLCAAIDAGSACRLDATAVGDGLSLHVHDAGDAAWIRLEVPLEPGPAPVSGVSFAVVASASDHTRVTPAVALKNTGGTRSEVFGRGIALSPRKAHVGGTVRFDRSVAGCDLSLVFYLERRDLTFELDTLHVSY